MEEVGLANGTFLGGVGTRPHPPIECTPPEEEEAEDELHPPSEGRGLGGVDEGDGLGDDVRVDGTRTVSAL